MASKTQVDRQRLKALLAKEERKFIESHGNRYVLAFITIHKLSKLFGHHLRDLSEYIP
jgi:hypothetical protein